MEWFDSIWRIDRYLPIKYWRPPVKNDYFGFRIINFDSLFKKWKSHGNSATVGLQISLHMEGKERPEKEAEHSILLGGRFGKQGNLT